ncbi:P-loop containing nucleoside triphosphate hydrolase protein [Pleurotus pulmonarius]
MLSDRYEALNTVLAFVSSRKHLATTFPVVRTSVENLIKHPLELVKVAELKALLPDVIKFAYIPKAEHNIHGESRPDPFEPSSSTTRIEDDTGHVLILDFAENSKGKKNQNPGFSLAPPPSLTPTAAKKLVEKRNTLLVQAINDLIAATPSGEDPVALLQSAGRDHIPINPSASRATFSEFSEAVSSQVPDPSHRPSVSSILSELESQSWYRNQIVERRKFDVRDGKTGDLDAPLSPNIRKALAAARNITSLYTHQATAINALAKGENVIVSTSTASGKSVIYQVPVLRFLEEDASATAIFVYPTKALAQDQRAAMQLLLASCPGLEHIQVATYDGDTLSEYRAGIREAASIIFTNFDMIHAGILPHEELWRSFMTRLKLFAVDELHYYSNLFGSHVAQIMRRFRRVCGAVGNSNMRFVSCSATISNPSMHMKNIFGVGDIVSITEDGAPSGHKDFIIWNPPLIDETEPALGRRSSLSEATGLMRYLMKRGIRCILFCKIRKACELAMKALRADLSAEGRHDILQKTVAYRGGYSPEDRRRIETDAFSGNLLGIVATNALELGVDIGVLDAVIMLGFPVTIASFRQQAGRAGRRAQDALAVLVPDMFPVDQHFLNHPGDLWDGPISDILVDLQSEVILEAHLQCAAHEMPVSIEDEVYFGPSLKHICETRLTKDADGWYHPHPKFLPSPSRHISIRGVQEEKYAVVDVTKDTYPVIIEEIEVSRALFEIYEGGVFIHQGLTFIVREVSHDTKTAKVIRADVSWTTEPRDFTDVNAAQTYRIKALKDSPQRSFFGKIHVYTKVFGFFKVRHKRILDSVDVETPPWERDSIGMWLDVPKSTLIIMQKADINAAEAIHSAQHAFLNQFAMAADLKTECKAAEKEYKKAESSRKRPARLIFYDTPGKGGGVAAKAFDQSYAILHKAMNTVESCSCDEGCTNCILSPACKENNAVYSKLGALIVLKGILALNIAVKEISKETGPMRGLPTIVEAGPVPVISGVEVEPAKS